MTNWVNNTHHQPHALLQLTQTQILYYPMSGNLGLSINMDKIKVSKITDLYFSMKF